MDHKERISIMQSLMMHPGYKMFEEVMRLTEQAAYSALISAKDPHEMAKNVGVLKATKDLRSWAEREMNVADLMLKQEADKSSR